MATKKIQFIGSLGGGGADWNAAEGEPGHVQNRTHWVESGGMMEILPETTLADMADMQAIPPIGFVAGNTYVVKFNGTEYTCVAFTMEMDGMSFVCLGNTMAATGEDNGIPFIWSEVPPEFAAQAGTNHMIEPVVEVDIPYIVTVYGEGEVVHKLDPKFLPDVDLDTTLTQSGKAADAKAVGDAVNQLSEEITDKAPAIKDEESAYHHASVKTHEVIVEGNTFTSDTVKIVTGENRVIKLRSYSTSGISLVAHDGRFVTVNGTLSANTQAVYLQAAQTGYTDSDAIRGKRIRVITKSNVAVPANGYNSVPPALVVRNDGTKLYSHNSDKSDIFNHDFTIDVPSDAGEITLSLWYVESGVSFENVEVFAGIYLADDTVIDTGEIINDGEKLNVNIPEEVVAFDSMMHKSVQTVVIDTKEYIDGKTPVNMLTYEDLQYLSPEMYGAKGDGVANDTDALQACIDDAIAKGIPVRGYGSYKCSKGIDIKCDYGDFYLHKVEITAGEYVVKLTGTYNTIRIDNVRSYGVTGAAGFRFETDADTNCESNDVSLGGSTAHSNAIEFINEYGEVGRFIYYNRLSVQRLLSQQANTIYMWSNGYGCMNENSVWAKYTLCNNGYAIHSTGGGKSNRFYEICCEHSTKNVAYGNVSLINPRVSDCLNETAADSGILFKIVGEYPYAIMTGEIANWKSVDVSEAMSFEDCKQKVADLLDAGKSHGEAFYRAFGSHKMNFPVICEVDKLWVDGSVEQFNSRHCPSGKIIAYFNHKGFVPSRPWRNSITTSEYKPFETDGRVPTIFEIDADTTIYLEDSYCCIGINEVTIVQKNGHKAKVYGKDYDAENPDASLIFDGTVLEDGVYKLHCELAPFSMTVEYSGGVREYSENSCEGLYFGSNDMWTVERANGSTKVAEASHADSADTASIADVANGVTWTNVSDKPSTFVPTTHTHDDRYYTESEINSKLSTIEKELGTKAFDGHFHLASEITSGTLSSDRLPTVPITKGGSGATTATAALANLGLTATAAELNYCDGVTSNIQTQLSNLDSKISLECLRVQTAIIGRNPSGSYTGNGSTTSRTVDVGGEVNNASLLAIVSNQGTITLCAIWGSIGFLCTTSQVTGFYSNKCQFQSGKLNIASDNSHFNQSGVTYYYYVL